MSSTSFIEDPLYRGLYIGMQSLQSDHSVNELVDMCNTVHSNQISDALVSMTGNASRTINPSNSLFLLKFILAYSKKDIRFTKQIESEMPSIVLFSYQNNTITTKETIRLFVSGWRMHVTPWPSIADKAEGLLKLLDYQEDLRGVIDSLRYQPNTMNDDALVELAQERFEKIISGINILRSILV